MEYMFTTHVHTYIQGMEQGVGDILFNGGGINLLYENIHIISPQ